MYRNRIFQIFFPQKLARSLVSILYLTSPSVSLGGDEGRLARSPFCTFYLKRGSKTYFIYFLFLKKRKESKEGATNVPLLSLAKLEKCKGECNGGGGTQHI